MNIQKTVKLGKLKTISFDISIKKVYLTFNYPNLGLNKEKSDSYESYKLEKLTKEGWMLYEDKKECKISFINQSF